MKDIEISIIIPAYNEEKYLEKTINSIRNQDFKNYEIIVVCNGCTDQTEKIAKKYSKTFSIKNPNIAEARNEGARKAKGKKLVFLDADTLLYSREILENIAKEKAVIGTCIGKPSNNKLNYRLYGYLKNIASLFGMVNGITFCDRKTFFDAGGYNKNKIPAENNDLINKMKQHGKFKVLPLYVVNSMRRYEKLGFKNQAFFWLRKITGNKQKYAAVR